MSIKTGQELRRPLMAVAACRHYPPAQIIRDLMRLHKASNETPNVLTAETIRKGRHDEDVFQASSASDLFKQLDI
ncbi:hypothetical protein [Collimonas fungivorans]|uniref:hypothetical protein n=1 Tax=Collimonas fungivorans TaxID=158899 RepID=UPI0005A03123|nr:hypothetical protein [Collimonas fungivorans]